jgi:uncharacterized protein
VGKRQTVTRTLEASGSLRVWYHVTMTRDFIIDGYNLMHAAGLARPRFGPGGLERTRNRLLARLKELLTAEERHRTTVVFDAKNAPGDAADLEIRHGIYVAFARDADEADDLIEQLIARHSAPKQLLVVSSDHRLHKAARRRKAKACDSDRFLDHLEHRAARHVEPAVNEQDVDESRAELTPEQMQHWLNEFSDVDVNQIRRELGEKPKPAVDASATESKRSIGQEKQVPHLDDDEVAMWEDLLEEFLREDTDKGSGA